ncbi:50S ribosomal protein L24 [Candidatus Pelagibacter sp.]|nr:50S ribosomal protein L24 [Candidatus Pelagibacter sp.]|tara:strand:+ start:423 stop:671 length:249 start_codon:yes stop_codon:yes gene_type:complete
MIKKGLKVLVLAGKDKKKEGEVIELDRENNRAKVKEINMVKKHVKTTKEKKGGIFSKESFIHLSNLKLIDQKTKEKKKEAKR